MSVRAGLIISLSVDKLELTFTSCQNRCLVFQQKCSELWTFLEQYCNGDGLMDGIKLNINSLKCTWLQKLCKSKLKFLEVCKSGSLWKMTTVYKTSTLPKIQVKSKNYKVDIKAASLPRSKATKLVVSSRNLVFDRPTKVLRYSGEVKHSLISLDKIVMFW